MFQINIQPRICPFLFRLRFLPEALEYITYYPKLKLLKSIKEQKNIQNNICIIYNLQNI